ncbi:Acetylornithine deacetylase [Pluralibacter gergoviae]|nr:Acetylornithine deacetylase [Pluralibacter gergoviae]
MKNTLPPFIEIYRALIATPSISATEESLDQSNEALINLLGDWFAALGFSVEIQPVPGTRKKFNLLASTGRGAGGLLLTGHTDTVPFDEGRWTRDPFTLSEHDNKALRPRHRRHEGLLRFYSRRPARRRRDKTEKNRSISWQPPMKRPAWRAPATSLNPPACARTAPLLANPPRCSRCGPTKATCPAPYGCSGQSGHSSDPDRGVNAIELMHDAIGRIMQLRDSLKDRYHNAAFAVPYPTLNLGAISGGDAANRICACCELHLDIRPLPGMTLNDLNGLLNEALAPVSERWPGRLTVSELHPPIPGYECPPDHNLVQVVEKLLGTEAEVVNYCTEAPYIQTLCPTLVLGPGSINQAHQPDEFLETRFIKPTQELIGKVVRHFCWH